MLAGDLKALNESRRDMTDRVVDEAMAKVEQTDIRGDKVLVIYLPDCHESLAGIVAGRIRECYYKPVFVLTDAEDGAKGSGRSIDGYHMYEELNKSLISLIMRSAAKWCVIPMQDYLGLDNKCRMNTPSTVGTNWKWRIRKNQLSVKLQKEIYAVTLRYGRMNWMEEVEEAADREE